MSYGADPENAGQQPSVPAYVGRLAPTPTGYLHLGHAATFLLAWDRAREANGELLLRIDDLDPQRSREVFVEAAKEDLAWLGIRWMAEWRQKNRTSRYREALGKLLDAGLVYACRCSRKDLEQATEAPHEEGDELLYNGRCRPSCATPVSKTFEPETNYRFRVPEGTVVRFTDRCRGAQNMAAGVHFGDFVVWRKDGLPSYQLATVVDDADMGVTEVVRGCDLLRSTARQILLQRALGFSVPAFCHAPLLRDQGGLRLAKRNDALSLRTLRAAGVTAAEIRARVADLLHHSVL